MSGNLWAVLNNVEDDGSIKAKPAQSSKPKAQKKPAATTSTAQGAKPKLNKKAAAAFAHPPNPNQKKKAQPAAQPAAAKPAAAAAKPAGKSPAAPAKAQPTMIVKPVAVQTSTPSPVVSLTSPKIQNFQRALNQALNGQSAFFQVSLNRSSDVPVLQNNPYRVVGDLIKGSHFVTNLGLALKRDGNELLKKDVRTKIMGRVNRIGMAHHFLALLSGYSPVDQSKTDEEATRLVTEFFEALWNLPPPPEPVKRVDLNRDRDRDDDVTEEDEKIGSAGSVKRDAVTLFDFIAPAKGKKKGGKAAGQQQPAAQQQQGKGKEKADAPAAAAAPAAATPAPAAAAVEAKAPEAQPQQPARSSAVPQGAKKEDPTTWRTDLVDTARQLSRRIPTNIQCLRVEPTFLYAASEAKGKQTASYFKEAGCDHCYAFWEDGKADIFFLLTTGSA